MDLDEFLVINEVMNNLVEAELDLQNYVAAPRFYERRNAFNILSDVQFVKNFRLTKELARVVVRMVEPFIAPPNRRSALSVETKVLVALNFFGHGSYQEVVGKHLFAAISQPSVSRCINEIAEVLNRPEIINQNIKFPENVEQLEELRLRFFRKYQFPGIVGCVDGTLVAIVSPKENEEIYVNRKSYHSLNVQLVCDENLSIMSINSRFPGGSHDSHVWRQSRISHVMENIYRNVHQPFFLLGDSGYPLRPWLLTPLQEAAPETPEWRFNNAFKRIRSIIERCNGVLKNRFRCLLKDRVLHYDPTVAAKIINACAILHNLCIENNVPEPEEDVIENDFGLHAPINNPPGRVERVNADLFAGRQLRQKIIYSNFM